MAFKKAAAWMGYTSVNEVKINFRFSDKMIWEFAKTNDYTIITFDEDFSELQNLFSYPPKIIWLRTGNLITVEIAEILLKHEIQINKFLKDNETGVYKISLS